MCAGKIGGWVTVLTLMFGGTTALAQGGFGGNFDDNFVPPGSQTAPQTPPPTSGGGFGGNFDGGPSAPPPQQGSPGADDFSGGSFDPDFTAPRPGDPPPQQQTQPEPETTPPQPPVDESIAQFEGRDYGVPPTQQLRSGQMHAPTPTSLPGASVVSTAGLAQAMNEGIELVLIDVLGGQYSLPGAIVEPALASPGHFGDHLQQQAQAWLGQLTNGHKDMPIVIYCSDPYCWLSYNATLRAVAAGFTNVYWYRGGLQAWQMAGLRLTAAGF